MFYDKNLRQDEELVAAINKSGLEFFNKYIICFIFFLVPAFLAVPLFNWGVYGKVVFSLLLANAIYYFLKLLATAHYNSLIITSDRVINYKLVGFFEKRINEIDLIKVVDVSHRIKGLKQNWFKAGDLLISWQAAEQEKKMLVTNIKEPLRVQRMILDLRNLAQEEFEVKGKRQDIKESYEEVLKRIKKEIGEKTLIKLIKDLKDDNEELDNGDDSEQVEQAELVAVDEEEEVDD